MGTRMPVFQGPCEKNLREISPVFASTQCILRGPLRAGPRNKYNNEQNRPKRKIPATLALTL